MIAPPPRVVRRLLVHPTILVVFALLLLLSPLVTLALLPAAVVRRDRARLGLVWVVTSFAARELVGVALLTLLWVASGGGLMMRRSWMQAAHYRLMRWWIGGPVAVAQRVLGLHVRLAADTLPQTPLIILARHAGMGDSLLLLHSLLSLRRRPRLVIQAALQWDPCVDIVCHRVPTVFVPVQRDRRRDVLPAMASLARGLRADDALVIFPEGGNYSLCRRRRAVERLCEEGAADLAARAATLVHLLPPKPAGTMAILDAAPEVPVVVAAHAGLDHVNSLSAVLRAVPLRRPVILRWRLVRRDEIPAERHLRVTWLFDVWQQMDRWICAAADPYPARVDARQEVPGVDA